MSLALSSFHTVLAIPAILAVLALQAVSAILPVWPIIQDEYMNCYTPEVKKIFEVFSKDSCCYWVFFFLRCIQYWIQIKNVLLPVCIHSELEQCSFTQSVAGWDGGWGHHSAAVQHHWTRFCKFCPNPSPIHNWWPVGSVSLVWAVNHQENRKNPIQNPK